MRKPVLLLMGFALLALPAFAQKKKKGPSASDSTAIATKEEIVYPKFPGGDDKLTNYIAQNLIYPVSALNNGLEGQVKVTFTVMPSGIVDSVGILGKGLSPDCNKAAMTLVKEMPAWTPGKINGKPVPVKLTLPIPFKLPEQPAISLGAAPPPASTPAEEGKPFVVAEQMPEYPGGAAEMSKFFVANIKYPEAAREMGIQGKVYVEFVVSPEGDVTDIKIVRGLSADCDKEAIRVVKMMPKWRAGMQNGVAVPVKMTLPISFVLK